jgi:cell wall assembly regulator SMI1
VLEVDEAWTRIAGWLTERAPLAASQIRQPASPADIAALQGELPRPLPDDLVCWWRAVDGFTWGIVYSLIPTLHVPVQISEARRLRETALDLMRRSGDDTAMSGLAGDASLVYLDAFVPIAVDHCGQILFVDVRDGPDHGCVVEWDHEQGALHPALWDGVRSMLNDIADALLLGRPALSAHARLRRGRLFNPLECHAVVSADGDLSWDMPG